MQLQFPDMFQRHKLQVLGSGLYLEHAKPLTQEKAPRLQPDRTCDFGDIHLSQSLSERLSSVSMVDGQEKKRGRLDFTSRDCARVE
jgi:hypothetical protein